MTSFFQDNIDFLVLKSKKTSFDILIYIYSQGQEQFKSWISKKIFDWLGSQIISLIFIRREISCNNTHGKSLDIYLSKHVFTQEKLSLGSKRWLIFDPDIKWLNNQINLGYDSPSNFPMKNELIQGKVIEVGLDF